MFFSFSVFGVALLLLRVIFADCRGRAGIQLDADENHEFNKWPWKVRFPDG
jgi:hypothetical protein